MYVSRPPISVSSGDQLQKKNTSSQSQKTTTLAVKERGHELRHPSSRKFQSRETALGLTDMNDTTPDRVSDKSDLPANKD